MFSSSLFFRAVDPIIPQIAADLSEPAETVALLATAFALPYALMQPVLGAMGDVLGKTRTMFACLVIVTIATFAGAFAWNLPILMVSRVVSGIVAGGIFPISLALVAQIVPIKGRQVAISRLLAGGMLGNLLGSSAVGRHRRSQQLAHRVHLQRMHGCVRNDRGVRRLWRARHQTDPEGQSTGNSGELPGDFHKSPRQVLLRRRAHGRHLFVRYLSVCRARSSIRSASSAPALRVW